jgi:hypothetical protein
MLWSSITESQPGVLLPKLSSSEASSRVRHTVKVVFYLLLHEPVLAMVFYTKISNSEVRHDFHNDMCTIT